MSTARKLPLGARLRHWHRRLGISAALFVIWLAISGIVLNEGTVLGLDQIKIGGRFISTLYGLNDAAPEAGFSAGARWLVPSEIGALLDGQLIKPQLSGVIGFVASGKLLAAGLTDGVALLTPDGQLIETLHAETLPTATLRRIGLTNDQRIVIQGRETFVSTDGENWTAFAGDSVQWSSLRELPATARQQTAEALRPQMPLSRVLADAHSGRLFGRYGHWLVDAVGIAALLLALTGGWTYLRALRRQHH